jgi:hypothetical protein
MYVLQPGGTSRKKSQTCIEHRASLLQLASRQAKIDIIQRKSASRTEVFQGQRRQPLEGGDDLVVVLFRVVKSPAADREIDDFMTVPRSRSG